MRFSNLDRQAMIQQAMEEKVDVLVIGGGITGAGISLDATMRGMKTVVVEMQDFAAGTSSRSTKLVHGGLRYLKQFEVKMVAEVGKEREIVYENGPHVTTPEWMLLPMHKGGTFGKFSTGIGLRVYDFLAGVKRSERRVMLSEARTLAKEPLLKREGLQGGGYYVEYRTDDARLTMEVMKKSVEKGTLALNYTKVVELIYTDGIVSGVVVEDTLTGAQYNIHAKKVVNATGPWVDTLREADHSKKGKELKLSKGVHIVLDQSKFPLKQAVYFDTPDGRMVFAIPRDGKAYVGTTDTFYSKDPVNPGMTVEDRDYILEAIHFMFPGVDITADDVESSWAGIRPLILEEGKDPSEISRKDEIWTSDSGLITIAGGKLTGYRKMAETVVNLLAKQFAKEDAIRYSPSNTKHLPISGGDVGGSKQLPQFIESQIARGVEVGFTEDEVRHLAQMYGSNVPTVFDYMEENEEAFKETKMPRVLFAKLIYGINDEMVATPVDFLLRRTGALLFDIDTVMDWKEDVIAFMAEKFQWTAEQTAQFSKNLETKIYEATHPVADQ